MDNAVKQQSKRVVEPALPPASPGRDVLLALATAWFSSHSAPRAGTLQVAAPSASSRTFPAGHVGRWPGSR